MQKVKCALIQMKCTENKEKNIEKAARMAQEAADKGAKIVCLQELYSTLYFPQTMEDKYYELAEPIDGQSVQAMQEVARKKELV